MDTRIIVDQNDYNSQSIDLGEEERAVRNRVLYCIHCEDDKVTPSRQLSNNFNSHMRKCHKSKMIPERPG
jgi:hypothetical protein